MFARHRDAVVAQHRLEEVLVHAERRAEHAGADVGHARELEQPLHRAVLAERPVQHREDDVDVGERRRDLLATAAAPARPNLVRVSWTGRAVPSCQRPSRSISTVDDLVAARARARSTTLARRGERDLVLARAAAEDHGDAPASRWSCVVVGRRRGRRRRRARRVWSWPTVIVTTSPGLASAPGAGSWAITIPSWLGSVTGW